MAKIRYEGKTFEEVIQAAADEMGLPVELLSFTLVSTGDGGLFGLRARKAAILVDVEESRRKADNNMAAPAETRTCGWTLDPTATAASSARRRPGPNQKPGPRPTPGQRSAPGQESGREPGREPNLAPGPSVSSDDRPLAFPPPPAGRDPAELLSDAKDWPPPFERLDQLPLPLTRLRPGEAETRNPSDAFSRKASAELATIVELMGFEAEVAAKRLGNRLVLELKGPESALLIGPHGQALDALEHLLVKIIANEPDFHDLLLGGEWPLNPDLGHLLPQIVIDAKNFRARRHYEMLAKLRKLLKKALAGHRSLTAGQLSPSDRSLVRQVVEAIPGLELQEIAEPQDSNFLTNLLIVSRLGEQESSSQKPSDTTLQPI
jgi:predicted RNA-binding protein Jag